MDQGKHDYEQGRGSLSAFFHMDTVISTPKPRGEGVSTERLCVFIAIVKNFAPFTRVFRSTKTTLRQSVESIVFNQLAHLYSLVTAVVQELLSQTWKRTLDLMLVYIRYDWLL